MKILLLRNARLSARSGRTSGGGDTPTGQLREDTERLEEFAGRNFAEWAW